MGALNLKVLSLSGFAKIYRKHMRADFASNERKPCIMILLGMAKGSYVCCGFYDAQNTLVAYAVIMLARDSGLALLDYLAVTRGHRGMGYGAAVLKMLRTQLSTRDGIIIEYEHTEGIALEDDRCRRERFYLNAGMRRTGMDLTLYGVHYQVGYIPVSRDPGDAELKRNMIALYRSSGYKKFSFADSL